MTTQTRTLEKKIEDIVSLQLSKEKKRKEGVREIYILNSSLAIGLWIICQVMTWVGYNIGTISQSPIIVFMAGIWCGVTTIGAINLAYMAIKDDLNKVR